jgi:trigger factor
MLQEVEETNPTERRLKIEVPKAVVEEELDKVYKELRTTINIPGFRKGKVPRAILEKRFSKKVEAEIVGKLIPEFYKEAVEEAEIVPISQPNIEGEVKIEKNQPLTFSVTVEIQPQVKDLKYEGIEIEEIDGEVTEEELEQSLRSLQKQRVSYDPTDKGAEDADMVVIDFQAFIDDEPVEGIKEEDYQYIIGSKALPQEFKQELINKKKDDSCEFNITYPDDFHNKKIAGKTVLFKVTVKEVKAQDIPAIDDEFAKDLNYENLEELKIAHRHDIRQQKEKDREHQYRTSLLKRLLEVHNVEAPPSMVKAELDALVAQAKNMAKLSGVKQPSDEELYSTYREIAINNVKTMLILSAIGEAEKVNVTDSEVKERIDQIAKNSSMKSEDLMKRYIAQDGSLEGFKQQLYTEKVLDIVMSKATITKKSSLIV